MNNTNPPPTKLVKAKSLGLLAGTTISKGMGMEIIRLLKLGDWRTYYYIVHAVPH